MKKFLEGLASIVAILLFVVFVVAVVNYHANHNPTIGEVEAYLEQRYGTEVIMVSVPDKQDVYVVTPTYIACESYYITDDGVCRMDTVYFMKVLEASYEEGILNHTPLVAHNIMQLEGDWLQPSAVRACFGEIKSVVHDKENHRYIVEKAYTGAKEPLEIYYDPDTGLISKEQVVRECFYKMYFPSIEMYPWWTISGEQEGWI